MPNPTEASLVFADLKDAYEALLLAKGSPKNVRRSFSRFIDLSQKLTSAMRKDASRLGKDWAAATFSGWTPIAGLMKYLRNEDQHGDQVYIAVHERRHFPIPKTLPPGFKAPLGDTFVFQGTWLLNDQLLDRPPEGITGYEVDPLTRKPTNREMMPIKIERRYLLQARSSRAAEKLQAAGSADVHVLAESAFETYEKYYQSFCEQVSG